MFLNTFQGRNGQCRTRILSLIRSSSVWSLNNGPRESRLGDWFQTTRCDMEESLTLFSCIQRPQCHETKRGNLQSFIVESQSWNYIFISDVMYRSTKPASQKMSHCSNTCRQWCVLTYLRTVRYYIEVTMNVYWRRCLNNFCFYFQVQKWTLDEF